MRLGHRGEARISTLLYLLVAVLVIYVVVKVIPPYMQYYSMEDEVLQQVRMAKINPADTIRRDLLLKADEIEIDLDPADLELAYDTNGRLQVSVYWMTNVDFGYGINKDFEFNIDTSSSDNKEE